MANPSLRIGHGYDIHPLIEGRPLVLGGITIASAKGLEGHSDADALTHALADAIFGAVALPDIGVYFPNTDPACKGMNSQLILKKAIEEARKLGYELLNADITVIAEAPKLKPHWAAMRTQLAETLGVAPSVIGLKATTNEGMDATGRGEAIAAYAVVLLTSTD
ncbi:MAG: 2-C-methyl-D-erythritol 2,4-cyclodiphosphate synthase [Verrucomicrobia bacterium 21-51-4]|nr:MAG: 2-C-methyl-D-erythritol 2,4-cyclodiphosphate synthase [Verrucomicrobia bacterium 21-51-4]HQU08910.1 2-C-methyl-D-erythritol 2,4-cyclodiphosphate synthase [Opitutales bacterium]